VVLLYDTPAINHFGKTDAVRFPEKYLSLNSRFMLLRVSGFVSASV
jgi:hypothetical protein